MEGGGHPPRGEHGTVGPPSGDGQDRVTRRHNNGGQAEETGGAELGHIHQRDNAARSVGTGVGDHRRIEKGIMHISMVVK